LTNIAISITLTKSIPIYLDQNKLLYRKQTRYDMFIKGMLTSFMIIDTPKCPDKVDNGYERKACV